MLLDYLSRCAATHGPLPGAFVLAAGDATHAKWHCDGGLAAASSLPSANLIVLRLRPADDAGSAFVGHTRTVAQLNAALQKSQIAERAAAQLAAIVTSSSDAIISKTLTGVITSWNAGAQHIFGYTPEEMIGQSITRLLPPERLAEEEIILAKIRAGDRIDHYETVRVTKDGRHIDIDVTISPIRSSDGEIIGASKIARDITVPKQRERLVKTLMQEVNHRSKNMLGLVIAMARQSAKSDIATFMASFTDRIQALAASHDLLVKSEWQGTALDELVRAQLAHFGDVVDQRFSVQGCAVRVNSTAAQSIGMALHELATNAAKYGALSNDAGVIQISWGKNDNSAPPGDERFWMSWRELGGPTVAAPTQPGFGTVVVKTLIASSLSGQVSAEYPPTGFHWRFECQLGQILDGSAGASREDPA